ncbi:hypothetical protein M0805_008628 [Coniferiporia weirii]|nr:hypothetical protein M0805_008628 [Coniferiporia weirii]
MDSAEWENVVFLLGPWVIGGFLDILLQGILFCQFINYFTWYRDDKRGLVLLVIGLFIMTTLKSIQSFALVWIQNIVYFGDINGAIALSYTKWWQSGNGLMVAAIGAYVQSYFCYRLYVISQKWWVVVPIAIVFIFALIASVLSTYYTTKDEQLDIRNWYAAHLSSVFAGDTLLACTTAYFLLLKNPKGGLERTKNLIHALVRLTFQTATPAAICAMLNLIFSQIYVGSNKLVSSAFNMALPKIYAISMMWTLNARRSIRATHSSHEMVTDTTTNVHFRTRVRPDLELGRMGASTTIQIRTEIETMHHHDDEDDDYLRPDSSGGENADVVKVKVAPGVERADRSDDESAYKVAGF